MMMSNLPQDLVEEILSRVPATSLKQLRPTCKRWNALFNDQGFTQKHFRKATKESMVLMRMDCRVCLMSIDLNVAPPSIEFKGTLSLKHDISTSKEVDIVEFFHCDGLLLCKTYEYRLVVWNPCMGEARWIQLRADNKNYSRFALGYENNKSYHSYKILRCWGYVPHNKVLENRVVFGFKNHGFEIYAFSSDSWRVLDDVGFHRFLPSNGVSVKGNAYWIAIDENDKHEFLLSFDFTQENFKRLCLPPLLDNFSRFRTILAVGEEQLALIKQSDINNSTSKMEIWLTNKIDTVLQWSKSFTVDLPICVDHFSYGMTFSVDMEKKVVVCCGKHSQKPMYIIGEDHRYYREIPNGESNYRSFLGKYMYNYVPSLVQIQ
ncbi:putative F-box/kelch-repeat protein [Cardamine amara subsp. amara]|uniref:F-box/kelch-repeat protein n=1 Tax=Cardamine amara subsp. amara TaxID=228776 RepID=A0ABD0ZSH5_CARAN